MKYRLQFIIKNLDDGALCLAQDIFPNDSYPCRNDCQTFRSAPYVGTYRLYDNHIYRQNAKDKLLSLQQTKLAAAYAVEFQTLPAPFRWNNDAGCGLFSQGLKSTINTTIMHKGRATIVEEIYFDQFQHRQPMKESKIFSYH